MHTYMQSRGKYEVGYYKARGITEQRHGLEFPPIPLIDSVWVVVETVDTASQARNLVNYLNGGRGSGGPLL